MVLVLGEAEVRLGQLVTRSLSASDGTAPIVCQKMRPKTITFIDQTCTAERRSIGASAASAGCTRRPMRSTRSTSLATASRPVRASASGRDQGFWLLWFNGFATNDGMTSTIAANTITSRTHNGKVLGSRA